METNVEKSIQITSLSGKNFLLTIRVTAKLSCLHGSLVVRSSYEAFGVKADVKMVDKMPCIAIEPAEVKKGLKAIQAVFGPALTAKNRAAIRISAETMNLLESEKEAMVAPLRAESDIISARVKAQIDAMPKTLVLRSGVDWGDYSITTICEVLEVRKSTEHEISLGVNPDMWHHVRTLVNCKELTHDLIKQIVTREKIGDFNGFPFYEITAEESNILLQAETKRASQEAEKKRIADEARVAKEKAEAEAVEVSRKDAEENELFLWDAGTIYASAGNRMLHSMGAIFDQKAGRINLYTTTYANDMSGANTTYSIRETLKKEGFRFDGATKYWWVEMSDENAQKTIELLKKYDTKAWPETVGFVRCWECGTYSPRRKMTLDGPGYYCGC